MEALARKDDRFGVYPFLPFSPPWCTTHFLRNGCFEKRSKLSSGSFDNDVLHWLLACVDFAEIKTIYFLCKLFASSGFFFQDVSSPQLKQLKLSVLHLNVLNFTGLKEKFSQDIKLLVNCTGRKSKGKLRKSYLN